MHIAIICLTLSCVAQDRQEEYWKLKGKLGTTWTYDALERDKKGITVVMKVIKIEKGAVTVESTRNDGNRKPSSIVMYVKDGYWTWGETKNGKLDDRFRLIKLGAKEGDSWSSPLRKGHNGTATVTHMGTAAVKVPAGTYDRALHVRLEIRLKAPPKLELNMEFYFAPNVGLIKMEIKNGDQMMSSIGLKEFAPTE